MAVGTNDSATLRNGEQVLQRLGKALGLVLFSETHIQQPVKYVSMEKSSGIHKLGFSCAVTPYYYYLTRWALRKEQAPNVPTWRLKTKGHLDCSSTVLCLAGTRAQVTQSGGAPHAGRGLKTACPIFPQQFPSRHKT